MKRIFVLLVCGVLLTGCADWGWGTKKVTTGTTGTTGTSKTTVTTVSNGVVGTETTK